MKRIIFVIIVFIFNVNNSVAQIELDIETGKLWNDYNNVEVPLNDGTRFSLTDNASVRTNGFFRLQLMMTAAEIHTIRLLYAPLRSISQGQFSEDVLFAGQSYSAGTNFTGIYKFNSYRVTYRYNFSTAGSFHWGLGLSAKIRDAEIEVVGDGIQASKTDFGFVPLINFNFEWYPADKFSIQLTGDALVSPYGQGRAEDALLALRYHWPKTILKAGYRILEGGADVSEVYNFTLFHYAVVGATITL
ncbi:MAG: hypothetical protein ACOCWM_04750 [Cyclobacteriaceae bacterium]